MSTLGIRSAPGHIATNSRPFGGREACVNCGFCRSGCRIDAKYQADRVLVAPALERGSLTLLANTAVTRIHTTRNGRRAEGVTYVNRLSGEQSSARARVVIACNNPLEIPRLLLNSASSAWPAGLGNRYDQVGRHFFCHLGIIGLGITKSELRSSTGHNMGNLMSLDYAVPRRAAPFVGGFSLLSLNGAGAGVLAVDALRDFYGLALKQRMRRYNESMFMVSFVEGQPSASNRITLADGPRDSLGLSRARIEYAFKASELELAAAAARKMRDVLTAASSEEVHVTPSPFEAHPMGSMRMGNDPRTSATDAIGRVHGLENVFVGGAALFVTGGAVNPTLTIHALALRTAEHVARELGGGCHG
jgi:choline dehydrogenase-like flavoprotein